ncbi:MazG nucleotide pyrophosphohydrolase domain-containing protein [Corynebacterium heidelbergense]|uniref:NTP pyrophosphohydrolase MazG-like domain-containing protein n=1 Tax=Corynebacterium heidelbergense TaxID=2055947 RepID=A0A364V444_9CORY|nr:MazG nucleotide pyrophosphohydrolase domain-containing protein [Corynebacterium heidelbergense]RAV31402.1 hypothetical protein DLJ54_08520 [Corynebacterium heidelbergense]
MSIVLLDPRFPAMVPVEAIDLLRQDVAYTEEVPVRVRWVIADLGGHTVDSADVLVTTDLRNELVQELLEEGAELVAAPSLLVQLSPDRELPAGPSSTAGHTQEMAQLLRATDSINRAEQERMAELSAASDVPAAPGQDAPSQDAPDRESEDESEDAAPDQPSVAVSGGGVVDGEIVGTDEHTAAVAGLRRTTRTEVPASVLDEVEDAIALMARALRQGEWEQSMTHSSLLVHLREETEELARIVELWEQRGGDVPEWMEQELCQELADVLLQVLFHAEIANRRGAFDIGHVAGAFTAKLRSRAPYLFEEVERNVPAEDQQRLWQEAKVRETARRVEKIGPEYREFLEAKSRQYRQPSTTATGNQAPEAPATGNQATLAPVEAPEVQGPSGLAAAEQVIAEARKLGLSDADIPAEIRFPLVGLELDNPGQSDQRLLRAVHAFRATLRQGQRDGETPAPHTPNRS